MKKHRFDYFASCPTGLEDLLLLELKAEGAQETHIVKGGISFSSENPHVALKVLLKSRVASRVFKKLYSFECHNENSMYQELCDIKWKSVMDVFQTFKITTIYGKLDREREFFTNSQFTTLKAKDAIVDWFNNEQERRPNIDKENPDISFLIRVDDSGDRIYQVQLMLDLCGSPLSQRGYRVASVEAPVRENLAAGILMLLNWDPKTEALVDGLCGSGTFLIEGAMIAKGLSAQYLKLKEFMKGQRPWSFLSHQWFAKDKYIPAEFQAWAKELYEQDRERLKTPTLAIMGSDIDPVAVKSTKLNLERAGMNIPVKQMNAHEILPPQEKSLFICNPPYGDRLMPDDEEKLKELYKELGENWKRNWKGHRAGVLTGNLPMLKSISLRTSKKIIIFNGDIECRVAEYQLF
ncbi:MAG: hypothetical protein LW878_07535 [Proteobacteria bacterium]|jgi:23S rRNA G2445 N2-methylase RlmL|nr:hypothetical protein [Pseudomonadota bacterium]